MVFACKKCKKCFRKDVADWDDRYAQTTTERVVAPNANGGNFSDEFCPHCDNHFVLEAKTPSIALNVEGEDVRVDARMLKDDRTKVDEHKTIWNIGDDIADKLG